MAAVISSTLLALGEANREHKWREEDTLYRGLINKQFMLTQKDRLVDLRSRGLSTISGHSALMAGFTIVMFVELQVGPNVPAGLIVCYGGISALVCCMLSLTMIQTMLVLTAVSQRSQMMENMKEFNDFWVARCDEKWRSTFRWFAAAVPVFFIDISIAGWVKFYDTPSAAITITIICIIAIIIWSFDQYFWGTYIATIVEYKNTVPSLGDHSTGSQSPRSFSYDTGSNGSNDSKGSDEDLHSPENKV